MDGVYFVPLAPLRDPDLVVSAVAQVLGVRQAAGRPLIEAMQASLREQTLLLVLDNFEHLPDAASLVSELLAACPRLKVLATSRAPLHLYGEYELPSLRSRSRASISFRHRTCWRWCRPLHSSSNGHRPSAPTSR